MSILEMKQSRRVRMVQIPENDLLKALAGTKYLHVLEPLPEDARLVEVTVGVFFGTGERSLDLLYYHDSFELADHAQVRDHRNIALI